MYIFKKSILTDNYVWFIHNNKECIVIDPGDADIVLYELNKKKLNLIYILLTHNHIDHTAGVNILKKYYSITVFGPKETLEYGVDKIINKNSILFLLNKTFKVLELKGHTSGHLGYYIKPFLFCGDVLFSAGCGNVIEGNYKQMFNSIKLINKLPKSTWICSAHEYSLKNLFFAQSILKTNKYILNYLLKLQILKKKHKPIPTTNLYQENKINIFLMIKKFKKNYLDFKFNKKQKKWKIFKILRKLKNNY